MMGPSLQATLGCLWSLLTLSLVGVSSRIFARIHKQKQRQLRISDYFLVIAWLNALVFSVLGTVMFQIGGNAGMYTLGPLTRTEKSRKFLKLLFTSNLIYDLAQYLPKASLLAFYLHLIPKPLSILRKVLYGIIGFVTISFIITICLDTFWCHPISDNWSLQPSTCKIALASQPLTISWSLNITSNLLIFALPFTILPFLQLSPLEISCLISIFVMGGITMIFSIVRFVFSLQQDLGYNHALSTIYIWSSIEINTSLLVATLPLLRSLLPTSKQGKPMDISGSNSIKYRSRLSKAILTTNSHSHLKSHNTNTNTSSSTSTSDPTPLPPVSTVEKLSSSLRLFGLRGERHQQKKEQKQQLHIIEALQSNQLGVLNDTVSSSSNTGLWSGGGSHEFEFDEDYNSWEAETRAIPPGW